MKPILVVKATGTAVVPRDKQHSAIVKALLVLLYLLALV